MPRSEVLTILAAPNLKLITRDLDRPGFGMEVWAKEYWFGHRVVSCYYGEDLRLFSAHVRYESDVFPSLKRMRNYSYPSPKPTILDYIL